MSKKTARKTGSAASVIQVRAAVDSDRWGGTSFEGLWATKVRSGTNAGRYRIDNIPMFADSLALHDIVACTERNGIWFISRVVERGGNSTVRLLLAEDCCDKVSVRATEKWLAKCRLPFEGDGQGFFCISVKNSDLLAELVEVLEPERQAGSLNFEIAYKFRPAKALAARKALPKAVSIKPDAKAKPRRKLKSKA